ncbi:GmrSD restriction endonuclease domain-containing protein [Herpetosiphon geysericola]|uniref:DUF262 domain-containing protein n=1 Tax=Herpetosiphon geysericola TaxID=70996 RepID=A0A0P6YHK3_9CHLR|nr:DUF262 domain-containing protein [Herpetosiphon geysericola]KPL91701.1 hypothetical protein SE18_01585 [Herpetosiphon geysericola]
MKAKETALFEFLNGTKQFVIPIYQRTYSWTREQCEQLWSDIERLAQDVSIKGHFIGSVVYVEDNQYSKSVVPQLLVIDGQQRLTTLSLLLAALANMIDERTNESVDITSKKLYNYYLRNNDEEGDRHYKLILTQSDKSALINVVNREEFHANASSRIQENYRYFLDRVRSTASLQKIFEAIKRIIVVEISLERDKDNPQLIFESLNSTGLKLTQADLIRNYILMGQNHTDQTSMYTTYWHPMEQRFGSDYSARFNRFMRDYLTIRLGRIPNIEDVYDEFKRYMTENSLNVKEVVADIGEYSGYFADLNFATTNDQELDAAIRDLHILRVDVAYPFLMQCMRVYKTHRLSKREMVYTIRLSQSYVFRRAICGIPTNSLNKTFANLLRDMENPQLLSRFSLNSDSSFMARLEAALLDKDSYRRFPNDEEFRRELLAKDINNFRNRNYLLYGIHMGSPEASHDLSNLSVTQIVPTSNPLSVEWQNELGIEWQAIQGSVINRLINLSLVQQPRDEQASFAEKKHAPGGFADTPGMLNRDLMSLQAWDERAIQDRAFRLAQAACTIWAYPTAVERAPISIQEPEGTAIDSGLLQGIWRECYDELRQRILNLSTAIQEEQTRLYIAFKLEANFCVVEPQRSRLRVGLRIPFDQLHDPQQRGRNTTGIGNWGNATVEYSITGLADLDYAMELIQQAFNYHNNEL